MFTSDTFFKNAIVHIFCENPRCHLRSYVSPGRWVILTLGNQINLTRLRTGNLSGQWFGLSKDPDGELTPSLEQLRSSLALDVRERTSEQRRHSVSARVVADFTGDQRPIKAPEDSWRVNVNVSSSRRVQRPIKVPEMLDMIIACQTIPW